MTTSYKLSAIKELKAQKKILREQEAIALKEAREEANELDFYVDAYPSWRRKACREKRTSQKNCYKKSSKTKS